MKTLSRKKIPKKKIKKLCEQVKLLSLNDKQYQQLKENLGDNFAAHYKIRRPKIQNKILRTIIELDCVFYIITRNDNGDICLTSNSLRNEITSLYDFIYEKCNPHGYYYLEKSLMELL